MRCRSLTATLVGAFFLAPTVGAVGANAPAVQNVDGGTLPPGEYKGLLLNVPGTDGAFTVSLEMAAVLVDPKAAAKDGRDEQRLSKEQEQINKLRAELAASRTASEREHRLAALNTAEARAQAQSAKVQQDEEKKELRVVDFQTAEGCKVRAQNPPTQFDDKGNLKKYTPEELSALKGKDKSLTGYESAPEGLKVGDVVRVTLTAPKLAKKEADGDKTGDAPAKPANQVTLILILNQSVDAAGRK